MMNAYENTPGGQNEDPRSVNNQVPQTPDQQVPGQQQIPSQPQAPIQGAAGQYGGTVPPRQDSPYGGSPYGAPPYANSPYAHSPYMNQPQDTWGNPTASPKPPKHHKEKKPHSSGSWGKRVLAGVVAVALVAAGSGVTALCLNNHWSNTMADIRQENEAQIAELEKKIGDASRASIASTPAGANGTLTPSQVYAKNVGSVVAIVSTMGANSLGQVATGSGSGFILSPDGYIATNCHVIDGAVSISVITGDNTEYKAKLLGKDSANDVAILKIDGENLPAVTIGSSNDLLIGDMVVAIGNPLGELTATQTVGYIGGKDRTISTGGAAINMLQTDAAINAGNSGGPLFNMKGEVVGITTAKYSGTTGSGASIEGIGFAVPIDDVTGIMKDLATHGYVTGPYLGVSVRDVDSQIASVYNIPLGAYVVEVVEGASADRAGIQPKDIITRLGDKEIRNSNDLIRALRNHKAGETVSVTFNRGGATETVDMELDEKPQQKPSTPTSGPESQEIPMPEGGDYDDWYKYFDKFFGDFFGVPRP